LGILRDLEVLDFIVPPLRTLETNNAKFIENIQSSGSQLHKDFTFEGEHIVIPMTTIPNDEVVVSF